MTAHEPIRRLIALVFAVFLLQGVSAQKLEFIQPRVNETGARLPTGLRLEPQRAPVDVVVIDSVERPTPD